MSGSQTQSLQRLLKAEEEANQMIRAEKNKRAKAYEEINKKV